MLDGGEDRFDDGRFEKTRSLPAFNPDFIGRGAHAHLRCDGHHHDVESGGVIGAGADDDGTRTTSPNSKPIVDVVVGIAPDFGENGCAGRGSGASERALLCA